MARKLERCSIAPNTREIHMLLQNRSPTTRCSLLLLLLTVLAAADPSLANPSWAPDLVAPRAAECALDASGRGATITLEPFSYSVLEIVTNVSGRVEQRAARAAASH